LQNTKKSNNENVFSYERAAVNHLISFSSVYMSAFTDVVANIGSGTLSDATTVLSGPIGYIVIGLLALGLVGTVIYAVRRWF
jgi:hypothetical protein